MRALSPLRLDRLSYLVKVPLALCMVSILSALGVFAVTYYLIAAHINAELLARVEQLSGALATSARGAIARDEIWDVYQQIAALVDRDSATQIIVVARDNTILVASDPVRNQYNSAAASPLKGRNTFSVGQRLKDDWLILGTGCMHVCAPTH